MKRLPPILLLLAVGTVLFAQKETPTETDRPIMQPKVYNFYTFTPNAAMDVSKEPALFPDSLKGHPEFGILPYNTQCKNCYEELGKRTATSRYFVEPGSKGSVYYVQQSYFPLHYKNKAGYWITLDHRMKPHNGGYGTIAYPITHAYNSQSNFTSIETSNGWFEFNSQLSAYFQGSGQKTSLGALNESNKTIGSDGVQITNAWPRITIQHIFKREGVKTNFVLAQKPNMPSGTQYLVFEQQLIPHLHQQTNSSVAYASTGSYTPDGFFVGDIEVSNANRQKLFTIKEAKYYDGHGYGTSGLYNLTRHQTPPAFSVPYREYYTLQILVPVSFLNDPNVQYPLYIDPLVVGFDSIGRNSFQDPQGNFSANMGFSNTPLTCNYFLTVEVPGMSDIQDTYIDIEYENTFSATCGTPPLQPPFCRFQDVRMEVRSLDCSTTTGPLTCNPAVAPFIGTCTTDPNLVPGASALRYPNFLACVPPQCPNYFLDFELRNSELQCDGDVCGYNCAQGHYFAVTIQARTIENTITLSRDNVCAGDTVTVTANPIWGVPPYRYEWTPGGLTDSIIIFSSENSTFISCIAYDVCNNAADVVDVFLTTRPSPSANAGDTARLCEGGNTTLGGNPTTNGAAPTFVWTAEPPVATSYLNATSNSNPTLNLPVGLVDTLLYFVRVNDNGCFRRDTVVVYSGANPLPVIVPDTAFICPGEGATFNTTEPFAAYAWSDGSNNAELLTFDLGSFNVIVTDGNGCTGTSNSVVTLQPNLPTFNVFASPDSVFNFGESAVLGSTLALTAPPVDSFGWSPPINISCLDCPSPVVNPEADQVYVLEVYSQGCRILDSILIDIKFPNAYWIPRAFTPNNDGLNDRFFVIKESGVTVKDFKIFNRWGQLIYNAAFPWDGISKGEPVDMGVYSFIFTLVLSDGKEVVESGQVTVIK